MARPSHSNQQKEEIRKKIRAAASKLYKASDGEKITARKVATEAGVSIGTLYAYFENLSEIMQSLWREPVRRLVSDMELLNSEIDCPEQRLKALMLRYIEFSYNSASVFRNSFLFVRPESMAPPPQVALERDRFFQLYRTTLREGQLSGKFREGELDELTQLLLSAIHGSFRQLVLPQLRLHKRRVGAMLALEKRDVSALTRGRTCKVHNITQPMSCNVANRCSRQTTSTRRQQCFNALNFLITCCFGTRNVAVCTAVIKNLLGAGCSLL